MSKYSNKILKTLEPLLSVDSSVLIKTNNLSVKYNDNLVINDINLTINKGEFIGLIGPNGAGKSTLLKSILGLIPISSGTIENNVKNSIGYVPQRGFMRSQQVPINVSEIVGLSAKNKSSIKHALKEVGIADLAKNKFNELSGGQQQRALIAKCLVGGSKLLVLDEPTTGIDEPSQNAFFEILRNLTKKGITIIIVSHDVDVVLSLVTRVVCLNQKILYDGLPESFEFNNYLPDPQDKKHFLLHHPHNKEGN